MTPADNNKKSKKKFMNKALKNKDVDYLTVDKRIPGQEYVCLSFVSPEAYIKQRHHFYFEHFLRYLSAKLPVDEQQQLVGIPKTKFNELLSGDIGPDTVKDSWDIFVQQNNDKLSKKFDEITGGRTSMRGLKVRGSYATHQEAKRQADALSEIDRSHNVYIGQVGYWLPWDPDPFDVPDQEYQNKELNMLMKNYEENLASKDKFYEERKREKIRQALEETERKKQRNHRIK
jgi:hypothetical protein